MLVKTHTKHLTGAICPSF